MRRADLLRREPPDTSEAEAQARRDLKTYRDLEVTFGTDGWKHIDEMLAVFEVRAQQQVEGGAKTLDEIYAQRERLALIRWLRGRPEDTMRLRAEAENQLEGIDNGEEE